MQIAVLGPLTVRRDDGTSVTVVGARLTALLTRLALEVGRPVTLSELAETVWGTRQPVDVTNAVQTLVSRLRRALGGAETIVSSASGYRLALDPAGVDAARFAALLDEATAPGAVDPLALLDDALALWRGRALADTRDTSDALENAAAQLDARRVAAVVLRATVLSSRASRSTSTCSRG